MNRRVLALALLATSCALAIACSEASDGAPRASAAEADASAAEDGEAPPPIDEDAAKKPPPDVPFDAAGAKGALLNDLSPSAEWVEIVNGGKTAVDLSGYYVADLDRDGGVPKLDEAVTIPSGTILSPNAYVVVKGGSDAGACPEGGWSYCLAAEWGVSNKNGETIFLLDPQKSVVGTLVYPPEAVPKGDSWGRVPSGDPTGTFEANVPTPGEPNQAR